MILFVMGCLTAKNYPEAAIDVGCDRFEECQKGDFDALYEDHADCVQESLDPFEELYECLAEACDFDASVARDCLNDLRTEDCADFDVVCGNPYVDCDESELADCGADVLF